MSGIIRLILLLTLAVCISEAQLHNIESCLCQNVSPTLVGGRNNIKEIQIYRETTFCTRVEIQVTMKNGLRYCLDPSKKVSKILSRIMRK
ncbi:platelet basic protein-like isoform X1 [Takifugu flavidus]|uniref:platelet basic protein-like isoform X1 n=1 Tax=Takifugu flavidus TaxID=433684 RepID=UPI002544060C|nr:platelet basic protein-like isoform X1 [Takifugu flavidus]